jgi:chaperonin GroES
MSFKITPCLDRVVVRRTKSPDKSQGGIIIPESAQDANIAPEGVVVAVGPGRTSEQGVHFPPYVKVGDRVLFSKYAGLEARPYNHTRIKGEDDLLVMRVDEIHAILEEDEK